MYVLLTPLSLKDLSQRIQSSHSTHKHSHIVLPCLAPCHRNTPRVREGDLQPEKLIIVIFRGTFLIGFTIIILLVCITCMDNLGHPCLWSLVLYDNTECSPLLRLQVSVVLRLQVSIVLRLQVSVVLRLQVSIVLRLQVSIVLRLQVSLGVYISVAINYRQCSPNMYIWGLVLYDNTVLYACVAIMYPMSSTCTLSDSVI